MLEGLWPCAGEVMNGQVTGFFPSSVSQVTSGYTPDFWSACASTMHTAFHHPTAKLCPAAGGWSRHRGCRLLWEWYYQVRKLTLRVYRAGVIFNVNLKSSSQDYLIAWRAFPGPALLCGTALLWEYENSSCVFLNCLTLEKQLYPKIEILFRLSTHRPHYLILILCYHSFPVSNQNIVKWLQWAMLPGDISLFSIKDIDFAFFLKIVPQYCLLACNVYEQNQIC